MEHMANRAILCGTLAAPPTLSHENHGRRFFKFLLEVERLSGTSDTLPVLAAEEVLTAAEASDGDRIRVEGQIRSFNSRGDSGRRLVISVYADSIAVSTEDAENDISLTGSICKAPVFRRTPLGREICDVMLAVPRRCRRTDYIPCILWGRTAQEAAALPTGSKVEILGRLQSREYLKVLETRTEKRVAYEVSAVEAFLLPAEDTEL